MNNLKAVLCGIGTVWLVLGIVGIAVAPFCYFCYMAMKTQAIGWIIASIAYGISLAGGGAGYSAWGR